MATKIKISTKENYSWSVPGNYTAGVATASLYLGDMCIHELSDRFDNGGWGGAQATVERLERELLCDLADALRKLLVQP